MKFSTWEDINAPIESVFEAVTCFSDYERAAVRRGAEVRRLSDEDVWGQGAAWNLRFALRGKERDVTVEVIQFERPANFLASISSRNIAGEMGCELFELSRNRTRMTIAIEIRPLTLPARLLIQSLKLTKSRITRKYKDRVSEFAADIERRHRAQT